MSRTNHKKFDAKPILDRYMDQDFALFACGNNAPTEKSVRAFENTLGVRLPQDFVDFSISSLGGVYIEVKEEFWPRHKAGDVGQFWSFLYGFYTMGFGKTVPEWMDIRIQTGRFKKENGHNVVPFLKVIGDADVYCFDSKGNAVRWSHETDEFEPQGKSFAQILEFEVSELKERKEKKKAGSDATGKARGPETW